MKSQVDKGKESSILEERFKKGDNQEPSQYKET